MRVTNQTLALGEGSPESRDMSGGEVLRFGHDVVEWVASYLEDPARYPVLARCKPGELDPSYRRRPPERRADGSDSARL